jgi:hypothetical protein
MTPTERFIRKAVEGGWRDLHAAVFVNECNIFVELRKTCFVENAETGEMEKKHVTSSISVTEALFGSDLWRCAGKALGWEGDFSYTYRDSFGLETPFTYPAWLKKQHGLLDALASGQTADAYLAWLLTDANPTE